MSKTFITKNNEENNRVVMLGIPLFLAVLFAAIALSMTLTILLESITKQTFDAESIYVTIIALGGSISFFAIAHHIRLTFVDIKSNC